MDRERVDRWVADYVTAWTTPGTELLSELFSPDATYLSSPWARPVYGLEHIARFWEEERESPEERFEFASEVVAVEGNTAVVRVSVDYLDGGAGRWRDLWVLRFDAEGRCAAFEEWPFAPRQSDGH